MLFELRRAFGLPFTLRPFIFLAGKRPQTAKRHGLPLVVQMEERYPAKILVVGSSPIEGTTVFFIHHKHYEPQSILSTIIYELAHHSRRHLVYRSFRARPESIWDATMKRLLLFRLRTLQTLKSDYIRDDKLIISTAVASFLIAYTSLYFFSWQGTFFLLVGCVPALLVLFTLSESTSSQSILLRLSQGYISGTFFFLLMAIFTLPGALLFMFSDFISSLLH